MRYQKVAFVSPGYEVGPNAIADHPPAGLGYLAQALESNFIDYTVIDQRLGYNLRELIKKIADYRPELIAVSMMTFLHRNSYQTIREMKKKFPVIDIIVGGPHISTLRISALEECEAIDFAVVLEGEETLVELCRGDDLGQIGGLIYRTPTGIRFNGERPYQSLNKVAVPLYKGFELEKYATPKIPLLTSRGCPYSCIYCPVEKAIGKRFRAREADDVFSEIKYWHGQGRRSFLILDDNFTLKPKRINQILDLMESGNLEGIDLALPNGIRADRVDRPLLKRMRSAGFSMLAFGVEAGNDKVLANIDKGEKLERIESAIKDACELGYRVVLFFLIGSPGETWDDFMDSVELARRYPVEEAKFYNLIPFPGTKLFDWITSQGYLVRDPDEYLNSASHFINSPCFETPEMSLVERQKAFNLAAMTSRRIRRSALQRRFKRLGPFSSLVALVYTTGAIQWLVQRSRRFKSVVGFASRELLDEDRSGRKSPVEKIL